MATTFLALRYEGRDGGLILLDSEDDLVGPCDDVVPWFGWLDRDGSLGFRLTRRRRKD